MENVLAVEGNKENVKLQTKNPEVILLQRRFSMRENRKGQALVDVNSNIQKVGGFGSGLEKKNTEDISMAKVTPSLEFNKFLKANHIANDNVSRFI